MARYDKCIGRLTQAAGRQLTDDEVTALFERIHRAALDIKAGRAEADEVGLGKKLEKQLGVGRTGDLLVQEAAARAAAEMEQEAALAARRANLQLVKMGARMGDYEANVERGLGNLDAVERTVRRDYTGRTNVESLEQRVRGVESDLMRRLQPAWDALGDDFLGFFQDRQKLLTLVRALRGDKTGDALADSGAKAFHDVAEEARQAFNAAGGDIGRLDDWGMPQHHSQEHVARAAQILGKGDAADPAANRAAWAEYMLPRMLKTAAQGRHYIDELSGQPWAEERMREFLSKAWDTIATDGIANLEPGRRMGVGGRAARHAEHRQIHFASAEDVIEYWNTFGNRTAVEVLHSHINTMAKDIAFVEHFGPNPDLTWQTLRDQAHQAAVTKDPRRAPDLVGRVARLDELWNYAAGRVNISQNTQLSAVADGIAQLNVAGKLGGAVFASLYGDKVMFEAVSHLNDIPMLQRWRTELATLNPLNSSDRRALIQQGLMLENVRSGLLRFYDDLGTRVGAGGFRATTGKFANAIMRMSGMTAINDFRKGSFGIGLYSAIGNEIAAGKGWDALAKSDVRTLRNYGITRADWDTWRLAELGEFRMGSQRIKNVLTPESIARIPDEKLRSAGVIGAAGTAQDAAAARRNATVKLLGAVNTESDFAVVTPGWKERALFYASLKRGTAVGEIARSALQFKSFPWAFFQRSLDAIANAETSVGKATMAAWLLMATTAAGAMIINTREMLSGKDPRRMFDRRDWYKFWGQAFLQGGALGIYGDFFYGITGSRYGTGAIEALSGPTLGPILSMGIVDPLKAIQASVEGKEQHLLAREIQSLKGFIPGNNLWYTKAAMEHLVWQRVMDNLSPGYLARMRRRHLRDFKQDWWWRPGEPVPRRTPELGVAFER